MRPWSIFAVVVGLTVTSVALAWCPPQEPQRYLVEISLTGPAEIEDSERSAERILVASRVVATDRQKSTTFQGKGQAFDGERVSFGQGIEVTVSRADGDHCQVHLMLDVSDGWTPESGGHIPSDERQMQVSSRKLYYAGTLSLEASHYRKYLGSPEMWLMIRVSEASR